MTAATQRLGEQGEQVAERWLRRRGWRILDRRWRSGRRDLDLVAAQGEMVAFVEVKARRRPDFGGPVEAVGWRKQRELQRSALCWIDRHDPHGGPGRSYRFDVIGVLMTPGSVRIRHVADAFGVPASG
jgi:putative endonuclease